MGELGERLRQAREEQGLSLADVEARTHIRSDLLKALENDEYSQLPELVYVRGFVRGYATALGLDPTPLLALLPSKPQEPQMIHQQVLDEPLRHPLVSSRLWPRVLLGLIAAIAVAILVWWLVSTYYLQTDPLAPLRGGLTSPTATPTVTAQAYTPTTERIEPTDTPLVVIDSRPSSTPTPKPTPTATIHIPATMTSTATASPSAPVEVAIRVDARTWLQVTVDGEMVLADLLEIGDEQAWAGQETIELIIGNAGGAYLTVNGVEIGYLGDEGEVIEVVYTPTEQP